MASSLCSLDSMIEYHKSGNKADSNLINVATDRIVKSVNKSAKDEDVHRAIRKSFFISADMAHAVHPNYAEKH